MENESQTQAIETQTEQQETSVQTDVQAAPSPATTQSPAESVSPAPQKPTVERSIPYSRFKESLSQRDNYASELKKAQELNQKYLEMLQSQTPKQQPSQTFEQQEAARQLAEILANQPQFKALNEKLQQLEAKTGDFTSSQTEAALDKEQETILKRCEEFGLDPIQVFGQTDEDGNIIQKGEIQKYIESHPVLKSIGIQPGVPEIAFRALYFDKQSELASRKANLALIKEQEAKKKAQTESPGSTSGKGARPKESMEDFLARRIEEEGGIGS